MLKNYAYCNGDKFLHETIEMYPFCNLIRLYMQTQASYMLLKMNRYHGQDGNGPQHNFCSTSSLTSKLLEKYDFKYLLDEPIAKSRPTDLEEGKSKPVSDLDESSSI